MRIACALLFVLINVNLFGQAANFEEVSTGQAIFENLNSTGVSVIDYDNDGDDDIYVCSGTSKPNRLYKNVGNFVFQEVAKESGLDINAITLLSAWFDADNDGWLDVYVGGSSKNLFFKNDKDGTFSEITLNSGLYSTATPFALLVGDLNGDQWLDIYCNNFFGENQLFLNYGATTFRDKIVGSGAESQKLSMGGLLFDQDFDGDQDIYLVFDGHQPNSFFRNDGNVKFQEVSSQMGLNHEDSGMGVDMADFNHDGKFDIYVGNLSDNSLFMSSADESYVNSASDLHVNDGGMTWGTVCFDFNNDSFSDIYLANDYSYSPSPNKLFKNDGGVSFLDVTSPTLESRKSGLGVATGDFDNDGLLDLVVGNRFNGTQVFKNNEPGAGNNLKLNLVGTASNKFAVGALVKVKVGGTTLLDVVNVGSSYCSQSSYTLHFGLGNATQADEINIQWPDGKLDIYTNVAANTRYVAIEQESLTPFDVTNYQDALSRPSVLTIITPPAEQPQFDRAHSVARHWNEALISAIRTDLARPTVHARNLFHTSIAIYDAWAAYSDQATTFLLNKSVGNFFTPFGGVPIPAEITTARNETISYAAFGVLMHRFENSPGAGSAIPNFRLLMRHLGYDDSFTSMDYATGSPAALGNYIASKVIEFGLQDDANEVGGYANKFYQPLNQPLRPDMPGSQSMVDCNRWQPLKLQVFIDQNGIEQGTTPPFLSPEWGHVTPFALKADDLKKYVRSGNTWWVYHDPGPPPLLDPISGAGQSSKEYMWNFLLVSVWASHLDQADGVMIDISPASKGNVSPVDYPTTLDAYKNFYNLTEGGDSGKGYAINPYTQQPYEPQIVPRGDYARVLAEFWADGPKSETPPGHWFTLLNYVSDHPLFEKRFGGQGPRMDNLEWDVKAYLTLGGALHDVAVSAWGIKGYYDGVRPISAIRFMADQGQSTDTALPRYHPAGIPLLPGFIELVQVGDPLAGTNGENINKIKLYTWKGPLGIVDPKVDQAGVDWILAENWYPYQRPSFVTPPFAGYISGHSTYSSAGAEILTLLTGDEYFPGGLGEFIAKKNEYLVFEEGPSMDIKLQWARYKDASDQSSLSRIWGGIHPPADDIPGRIIGQKIAQDAFQFAVKYFTNTVTAIEDDLPQELTFFPNPVSKRDKLKILSSEKELINVQVVDILGRLVMETELRDGAKEIDISTVATGINLIRIIDGGKPRTARLLVKD